MSVSEFKMIIDLIRSDEKENQILGHGLLMEISDEEIIKLKTETPLLDISSKTKQLLYWGSNNERLLSIMPNQPPNYPTPNIDIVEKLERCGFKMRLIHENNKPFYVDYNGAIQDIMEEKVKTYKEEGKLHGPYHGL